MMYSEELLKLLKEHGFQSNRCEVDYVLMHPNAQVPTKAHDSKGNLGWDIYCVEDEGFNLTPKDKKGIVLKPGSSHIFHTGLHMQIQEGFGLMLKDRGGMGAKKKIHVTGGIIDQNYTGEVLVSLVNLSKEDHIIFEGDKIVQGIFLPEIEVEMNKVDELKETSRGDSRFGSTDKE